MVLHQSEIPVVASVPVMVVSVMVNIAPVSLVVNIAPVSLVVMVPVVNMLVVEVIRAVVDNVGTLRHVVDVPGQIQVLVVVVKGDSRTALSWTQGVQPWRLTRCSGLVVYRPIHVVVSVPVDVVVRLVFKLVTTNLVAAVVNVVVVVEVVQAVVDTLKTLALTQDDMDTWASNLVTLVVLDILDTLVDTSSGLNSMVP